MEIRTNGTRYSKYKYWNRTKNDSYDYESNGLLKHLMSRKIIESKNEVLQSILQFFEKSLIFLMRYTDRLKNFKNVHYKNR